MGLASASVERSGGISNRNARITLKSRRPLKTAKNIKKLSDRAGTLSAVVGLRKSSSAERYVAERGQGDCRGDSRNTQCLNADRGSGTFRRSGGSECRTGPRPDAGWYCDWNLGDRDRLHCFLDTGAGTGQSARAYPLDAIFAARPTPEPWCGREKGSSETAGSGGQAAPFMDEIPGVQSHGGGIFVDTTPGEGTCFTLELRVGQEGSWLSC
jgi:hypothetical protein